MENKKDLKDTELNEVTGGDGWEAYTTNDRLKMLDGSVCPNCGHAVGTLRPQLGHALLICEKCGDPIGIVFNQILVGRA